HTTPERFLKAKLDLSQLRDRDMFLGRYGGREEALKMKAQQAVQTTKTETQNVLQQGEDKGKSILHQGEAKLKEVKDKMGK
ncbi:MAG: hypothetical protein Q9215_004788, partial [Flavoplaca cf. flavocitrina]